MTTPIPATPMDVVIFGLGLASELAAFLLIHDSPYRPVGFTVHERFVSTPELNGLPAQRFEDLERVYPPERYALLAPLAWRRMGDLRADVVSEGRARRYRFVTYVFSRSLIWPGFSEGENTMVCDGVVVQPFARIGENFYVRPGVVLSRHVALGDHCFVAAGATVGGRAQIGSNCVLGLNSTVVSGVRVAPRCFIAAGAVVTADTRPGGLCRGNPARRSRVTVAQIDAFAS